MKYTDNSFLGTPEVLNKKLGGELFENIEIPLSAMTASKLAAGTAVTAEGALSKGDGSDVYGITLNDCYADNPNVSVVRAFASINASNTTATSQDRAALTNLVFE